MAFMLAISIELTASAKKELTKDDVLRVLVIKIGNWREVCRYGMNTTRQSKTMEPSR